MQNQDRCYSSSLNINPQRLLVQSPNLLNQPMNSFSVVKQLTSNPPQLVGNNSVHLPPQASATYVSEWNSTQVPTETNQISHSNQYPHYQQQQQQQQQQRLKVEDALSYLDQVKLRFNNQPQVYNDFLDIMKEFKSQTIDTPGVIEKVSILFRGHNELIVGFNTFLPQGYSIEVRENETINVRQPGQQVVSLSNLTNNSNANNNIQNNNSIIYNDSIQVNLQNPHYLHGQMTQQLRQTADLSPNLNQHGSNQGQPVQFNHAITYVNKIKSCYQGHPEIYKAFLEILHNYQKEQKNLKEGSRQHGSRVPLTEAEVYSQVSVLFKDQPDLLMEFRQFLPDANGGNELMRGFGNQDCVVTQNNVDHQFPYGLVHQNIFAGGKSSSQSHNKLNMNLGSPVRGKSSSSSHSIIPSKRQKLSVPKLCARDPTENMDLACQDSELTKLVRRVISQYPNREPQCKEILKWVDSMIKKTTNEADFYKNTSPLLDKVPELRSHVRNLVGNLNSALLLDGRVGVSQLPDKLREFERIQSDCQWFPDLATCPQHGKHYRILPSEFVPEKSSGRTDLCDEVLNETHVICASPLSDAEGEGELTFKRNIYEEHVFQCEDERYELDMVIDLNDAVLKGMKRLMIRLHKMNSEELMKFQIDDLYGSVGVSEVHIETALKRLYGEKVSTMLEGLRKSPGTTVPLVVKSMQIKDKEWRLAKKSFERVWAEQIDKYYLKSLDFQGLKFKQNDIKQLRSKSLIKEIENLCGNNQNRSCTENGNAADQTLLHGTDVGSSHGTAGKEELKRLKLLCQDKFCYEDAVALILGNVSRQSGIQTEDRDKIKNILCNFLPSLLFMMPLKPLKLEVKQEHESTEFESGESRNDFNGRAKTSIKIKKEVNEEFNEEPENHQRATTSFHCNDNWYVLIRLLVLLCERLSFFKKKARQLSDEEEINKKLRSEMMTMALQARCPDATDPSSYYTNFLAMVTNLMNGFLELNSFEDQLREMFGIDSYVGFTMDKLIQNVIRQLQHVITKEECILLEDYYESAYRTEWTAEQYDEKARDLMKEKACFKLIVEKNSQDSVELFFCLLPTTSAGTVTNNERHERDNTNARSESPSSLILPNHPAEGCSAIDQTDAKQQSISSNEQKGMELKRRRRRKSSEVRGCSGQQKRLCLDKSAYSLGGLPDFFRKFRRRFTLLGVKTFQNPSTPQNCLVHALETIAIAHPDISTNSHSRGDYDNDVGDQCANDDSSTGSQKMTQDKDDDKSEDDFFCLSSFQRFRLKIGRTEMFERPGAMKRAVMTHRRITLVKKRRFDKWLAGWCEKNLTKELNDACEDWLSGTRLPFSDDAGHVRSKATHHKLEKFDHLVDSSLSTSSLSVPLNHTSLHVSGAPGDSSFTSIRPPYRPYTVYQSIECNDNLVFS